MSLDISLLFSADSQKDYLKKIIQMAQEIGLQTTSWQPGSVVYTILQIISYLFEDQDKAIEIIAKSGFLDTASEITPEPIAGEIYTPNILDLLAKNVYNVTRRSATYATGQLTFVNTGNSLSFLAGELHVKINDYTYHNVYDVTLTTGTTRGIIFACDEIGAAGSVGAGTVNFVTDVIGVSASISSGFIGYDYETNAQVVEKCKNKLNALSPGGGIGAYYYFLSQIPADEQNPVKIGTVTTPLYPITRSLVASDYDGTVNIYLGNANGAYPSKMQYIDNIPKLIINIEDDGNGACELTFATDHAYTTGDFVCIYDVLGLTSINNDNYRKTWNIYVSATNKIVLVGSVFEPDVWVASGYCVRYSDFDLFKQIVIKYCQPIGILAQFSNATPLETFIKYDIYVKQANATQDLIDKINNNIYNYVMSYPIGGGDLHKITSEQIVKIIMNTDQAIIDCSVVFNDLLLLDELSIGNYEQITANYITPKYVGEPSVHII